MEHWLRLHEYRSAELIREALDAARVRRLGRRPEGTRFLPRARQGARGR
ncbi:hypothetical protein [Georgenia thermotolerans]|uniref:Uncharacterized protein n=1 Tax=Georgenia thermotolerans TaxID=527326 RepID=A0A7J5UP34_9MICO|nr:hypothetical protein [Georgenia thermotolerans]KAE8763673.1 hypothetical protein GB883_12950 [Georgenia thermotolerans]